MVVVVRFLDEEVDEVRGRGDRHFGPISDMAVLATGPRSREGVGVLVPADGIILF